MATRTLEQERDRIMTVMMAPFMSCGARLAVYALFAAAFFPVGGQNIVFALYSSIDAQNSNGNGNGEAAPGEEAFSVTAALGETVATIPENLTGLRDLVADPLGFSVVQSDGLDQAAADQEVSLATFGSMQQRFDGTAGAMAYLLFILLYFPCVAALGAVNRETGPRWATFAALWTTGIAFYVAINVYQLARFADHPMTSMLWIGAMNLLLAAFVLGMRVKGRQEPTAVAAAEAG